MNELLFVVVELRVCVGCVGGVCVGVLVGGVDGLGQRDWIGGKGRSRGGKVGK